MQPQKTPAQPQKTQKTPTTSAIAAFPMGQIIATPGAIEALCEVHGNRWREGARVLLMRHAKGDWGDIHPEDRGLNEKSLENGSRLLSVYKLPQRAPGVTPPKLWIITEADRSATTLLLPDEY